MLHIICNFIWIQNVVYIGQKHKLLRPRVIERLGLSGQTDVVLRAQSLFAAHIMNKSADEILIPLRTGIYRTVLRWGDTTTFEQLLKVRVYFLVYPYIQKNSHLRMNELTFQLLKLYTLN